jgi:hypothetical protein
VSDGMGAMHPAHCNCDRCIHGSCTRVAEALRGDIAALKRDVAAAEERGRRAGIEEAADKAYTAAFDAAEEIWKLHGGAQEAPCYQAAIAAPRTIRKIESALAPRDSGKEG